MFQKSIKNGFNDLYIHPNVISRRLKSNSYLRSISASSSINSSTPNLCNVNLTQIMAELLVASTSLKNSCNNLYLHCKVFQMNWKSNSYMSQFLVIAQWIHQSSLFPLSIWHKQSKIYLFLGKSLKNCCNNFYLHRNVFKVNKKPNSYLTSISRRGPAKP